MIFIQIYAVEHFIVQLKQKKIKFIHGESILEDNQVMVIQKCNSYQFSLNILRKRKLYRIFQQLVINIQQLYQLTMNYLHGEMEIIIDQVMDYAWMNQNQKKLRFYKMYMQLVLLQELIIHYVLQMKDLCIHGEVDYLENQVFQLIIKIKFCLKDVVCNHKVLEIIHFMKQLLVHYIQWLLQIKEICFVGEITKMVFQELNLLKRTLLLIYH